jgi:hypothetical protein
MHAAWHGFWQVSGSFLISFIYRSVFQKVQKVSNSLRLRHPSAQVIRIMRFFRTSDDKTACDSILQHHRFSL